MCFFIHPKHQDLKIATKDIVCWKRLEVTGKNIESPYQGTNYYIDSTKASPIEVFGNSIHVGLHSYSIREQARIKKRKTGRYNERIFKAIIPKGSKYYYNPGRNEYVSNKLKIVSQA